MCILVLPRPFARISIAIIFLVMMNAIVQADEVVNVCDDISPWPPFSYPNQLEPGKSGAKQVGAMIEFTDSLFKKIGQKYTLKLKPWSRCLDEALKFPNSNGSEVVINASISKKRTVDYLVTKPIYKTTPGAFFSIDTFPAGPVLTAITDLKKYKICGVRGYNYAEYNVSPEDIYASVGSLKTALKKLTSSRCEIVVSSVEPVFGTKLFGENIIPKNVQVSAIPGARQATYHILIARGSPRGELLLKQLDQAIVNLTGDGTWDRISSRYKEQMNAK